MAQPEFDLIAGTSVIIKCKYGMEPETKAPR